MATGSFSPIDVNSFLDEVDPDHKLKGYYDLLESENRKINLVSRETSRADYARLSAESILPIHSAIKSPIRAYLDVGSGGGFPAFPLLLTQKINQTTLIEKVQKKAGALNRMGAKLSLPIKVLPIVLDDFKSDSHFDLITIRLVRLTTPILDQLLALLSPGGIIVYYNKIDSSLASYRSLASHHEYNLANRPSALEITSFKKK